MKVGIAVCSNGQRKEWNIQNEKLVGVLKSMGIEAVLSPHIMAKVDEFSGTDEERANDLMRFYEDESIDAIYDISGGDLANGVLKYLDFDVIARSDKMFWGYSDLTTIINAIYTMTGKASILYQVKNLVYYDAKLQQKRFADYLAGNKMPLFDLNYSFLQGKSMEGIVVGGNIRCLLKLAGTKYWPDMNGKILLLEALSGEAGQVAAMLTQLDLMGVFDQVSGVLLGTFTNYEKADLKLSVYDLLKMHINDSLPVAVTKEIGHGYDSKAIVIGEKIQL
ncbi:MAG: LD-carboxypeptidase [Lachnospiraceae bacterium]|nr:LD-carboxypeptidase [Lachnospiraceae bacterium]